MQAETYTTISGKTALISNLEVSNTWNHPVFMVFQRKKNICVCTIGRLYQSPHSTNNMVCLKTFWIYTMRFGHLGQNFIRQKTVGRKNYLPGHISDCNFYAQVPEQSVKWANSKSPAYSHVICVIYLSHCILKDACRSRQGQAIFYQYYPYMSDCNRDCGLSKFTECSIFTVFEAFLFLEENLTWLIPICERNSPVQIALSTSFYWRHNTVHQLHKWNTSSMSFETFVRAVVSLCSDKWNHYKRQ